MTRWRTVLVTASVALASASVSAWAQGTKMQRYRLVEPSTFQQGCVPPCDCPVAALPIHGTLRLVPLPPGPLFAEFAVVKVRWRVPRSAQLAAQKRIRIRGSGTYEVGGEFAVEQQLALDLTIGEQGLVHLDSGLVPGGGQFPTRIDVPISTSGSCMGTTIDVHAVQGRPRTTATGVIP